MTVEGWALLIGAVFAGFAKLLSLYFAEKRQNMAFARSLERSNGKGGCVEEHLNTEIASDPRLGDKLKKTRALARKQVADETP